MRIDGKKDEKKGERSLPLGLGDKKSFQSLLVTRITVLELSITLKVPRVDSNKRRKAEYS